MIKNYHRLGCCSSGGNCWHKRLYFFVKSKKSCIIKKDIGITNVNFWRVVNNKNAQVDNDIYIIPLPIKEIGTSETIDFYYAQGFLLHINSN